MNFAELAEQHRCTLSEEFLDRRPYAECSCGWIGEKVATRRQALADHAAHVHVVAGLAIGEGE